MNHDGVCVAIYPRHILAEEAVASLRRAGIDTEGVSIVGSCRGAEEAGGGNGRSWERTGEFWGGIWEVGSSTIFLADMGQLVVAGPLSRWVHGAIESGFTHDGLGPIGVALNAVGVPLEGARRYEQDLRECRCLLVLPCSNEDAFKLSLAIRDTQPEDVWVHERAPEVVHR